MTPEGATKESGSEYEEFFNAVSIGDIEGLQRALKPSINVNALKSGPPAGDSALHIASKLGYVEIVRSLLIQGAEVDILDSNNRCTPLQIAASHAQLDVVKILTSSGADVHVRHKLGTILHFVLLKARYEGVEIEQKHVDTMRFFLEMGVDVNAIDSGLHETVAHQAASLGSIELVKLLFEQGAWMSTALQAASGVQPPCGSNLEIVKFLLENGHDPKTSARAGVSAVGNAACYGNLDILRLLLSHSTAEACSRDHSVIRLAAKRGQRDAVRMLLDSGYNVDVKCPTLDETPLLAMCALIDPDLDVMKLLVERGANVNARNLAGETPLHKVAWSSNKEIVQVLLDADADVEARDCEEVTPLMRYAAFLFNYCTNGYHLGKSNFNPRFEAFKTILRHNPDVNAKDRKGQTALHHLVKNSPRQGDKKRYVVKAAELLIEKGIDITARTNDGRTVLEMVRPKDTDLLQYLMVCANMWP